MALNYVEFMVLVEKGLKEDLNKKETKKLLKALCNKFINEGLDSFKIRLLLAAHVRFEARYDSELEGNKKSRKDYIQKGLAEWRQRS